MTTLEFERAPRRKKERAKLSRGTTHILEAIQRIQPCTAKQVAKEVNNKPGLSTVRDHLVSLYYGGWIERVSTPHMVGYVYRAIEDE